jgi:hypothetical protein
VSLSARRKRRVEVEAERVQTTWGEMEDAASKKFTVSGEHAAVGQNKAARGDRNMFGKTY